MTIKQTFTQSLFFIFIFFGLSKAYSWCGCDYGHGRYLMNCSGNIAGSFNTRGECEGVAYNKNISAQQNRSSNLNSCSCDPSRNGYTVRCGMNIMAKYSDRGSCEAHAQTLTPGVIKNIRSCYCSDAFSGRSNLNCDGRSLMGFNSRSQCEGHLTQLY